MKPNESTFMKARNVVKLFIYTALALSILGVITNTEGSYVSVYFVIGALVCIAIALFVMFTCMKCPYCGKRIIRNCLSVKACPFCRRDLVSGMKVKGKKSK